MYSIYYDYEANYKEDYTLSVAIEDDVKDTFEVENHRLYERFRVDTSQEDGIVKAWRRIKLNGRIRMTMKRMNHLVKWKFILQSNNRVSLLRHMR